MKIHEDDSNSSKANKRVQAGERSGVLYAGNREKQRKLLQPFGLKKSTKRTAKCKTFYILVMSRYVWRKLTKETCATSIVIALQLEYELYSV